MSNARRTRHLVRAAIVGVAVLAAHADGTAQKNERYVMRGMVMRVAPAHKSFIVSHDSIPGVMEAMTMPFEVPNPKDLDGVTPGMTVEFVLVVGPQSAFAEHIQIRPYESVEQDPLTARRLKLLKRMTAPASSAVKAVAVGQTVPDFTLTDQARREVTLSKLRGRVVAVNFIYTSCALPQFCFRIANHFGVIQKRFNAQVGKDLVLLTVTFDPVRDQPERLAEYASQWNADPRAWHFLTGAVPDVRRVCDLFGVDFFPDEGLMNHSSQTAVIDRRGNLVANIEGNQFTARQIGDLVATALQH